MRCCGTNEGALTREENAVIEICIFSTIIYSYVNVNTVFVQFHRFNVISYSVSTSEPILKGRGVVILILIVVICIHMSCLFTYKF